MSWNILDGSNLPRIELHFVLESVEKGGGGMRKSTFVCGHGSCGLITGDWFQEGGASGSRLELWAAGEGIQAGKVLAQPHTGGDDIQDGIC